VVSPGRPKQKEGDGGEGKGGGGLVHDPDLTRDQAGGSSSNFVPSSLARRLPDDRRPYNPFHTRHEFIHGG
jgi:hypothetical protein